MTFQKFLLTAALAPALLMAQGGPVNPAELTKPLKEAWPTYNGDYSGKRYSALAQIDRSTVKHLTLAWMSRVSPGNAPAAAVRRRGGADAVPMIVGGEGPGDIPSGGGSIKASVLEVDGTLYFTTPDNAWAMDARDGRELWHYFWKTKGGTHIGNRGLAMWNGYLFMETPDDYLVSLNAKTGRSAGTNPSRIYRRVTSRRRRRSWWGITCWLAPAMTSIRPAFCNPSTRKRENCSGSSTPCR